MREGRSYKFLCWVVRGGCGEYGVTNLCQDDMRNDCSDVTVR